MIEPVGGRLAQEPAGVVRRVGGHLEAKELLVLAVRHREPADPKRGQVHLVLRRFVGREARGSVRRPSGIAPQSPARVSGSKGLALETEAASAPGGSGASACASRASDGGL